MEILPVQEGPRLQAGRVGAGDGMSARSDRWARCRPQEVFALVELVDSSLAKDVGPKRQLYARFGISDYLVVDLEADEVEHRSDPSGDRYFRSTRLARGATFTLRSLQGVALESTPFLAPE